MYRLTFHSYCGMSGIPETFDSREDARAAVAVALRDARAAGKPLTVLEPGESWEFLEPEDCAMIPDDAGTLSLSHVTFECRECGCDCETKQDAFDCCCNRDCGFAYADETRDTSCED